MRKRSQVWYTERWAGESSSQAPTMLDNLDLGIGNLHEVDRVRVLLEV